MFPIWRISLHSIYKNKHNCFVDMINIDFRLSTEIHTVCYVYKSVVSRTPCHITKCLIPECDIPCSCDENAHSGFLSLLQINIILTQLNFSHWENMSSVWVAVYCGAEAAAGMFVWISWRVRHTVWLEDPFIEEEVGLATLDFAFAHRMDACVTNMEPGSPGWLIS